MNSILVDNESAKLESKLLGLDKTFELLKADTLVNPKWCNVINKTIIINLDQSINFSSRLNNIISRIPIGTEYYKLEPYEPKPRSDKSLPKSRHILNKYIMTSQDAVINKGERFLLGTDIEKEGYLTCIGYLIN